MIYTVSPDGKAVTRILLGGATPLGWSPSPLDALSSALLLLWNASIYIDSSALTAGTVQAASE